MWPPCAEYAFFRPNDVRKTRKRLDAAQWGCIQIFERRLSAATHQFGRAECGHASDGTGGCADSSE